MTTITLQTEVQTRIDNLTYPIEATELLQNAVDTVGLGLDLTNIISVLDSSTSAITSGTPEDDVTALNAASLALGVTAKPGGSGGGSGAFVAETAVLGGKITAGAIGDIIIVTPPAGQRVRLTFFSVSEAAYGVTDVSIKMGSRLVVDSKTVRPNPTISSGQFNVGNATTQVNLSSHQYVSGNFPFLNGDIDEIMTISVSSTTDYNIIYAYQFGV